MFLVAKNAIYSEYAQSGLDATLMRMIADRYSYQTKKINRAIYDKIFQNTEVGIEIEYQEIENIIEVIIYNGRMVIKIVGLNPNDPNCIDLLCNIIEHHVGIK